jgi:hypothetical protein
MIDAIFRLAFSGLLLFGSTQLPSLSTNHMTPLIQQVAGPMKTTRSCPAQWASVVRTCVA